MRKTNTVSKRGTQRCRQLAVTQAIAAELQISAITELIVYKNTESKAPQILSSSVDLDDTVSSLMTSCLTLAANKKQYKANKGKQTIQWFQFAVFKRNTCSVSFNILSGPFENIHLFELSFSFSPEKH